MRNIALNYIYLSKKHAGGKDQVGINLLKGFFELGYTKKMVVFCFDYSCELILSIAPDVKVVSIPWKAKGSGELIRMAYLTWVNTMIIPKLIKKHQIKCIYHLSCNNGLRKMKCVSVVIPHDIKAVAHRVLANVKVPFYKYILYKIMYYIDFMHADHIIAISNVDKKEIGQYYKKFKHKIHRIYNPIDIVAKERNISKVQKNIVALNLQFHHKNIITLIKAFELIKDRCDYNLILIGSVPARVSYLKDYVKEHKLEDRVQFTGFVSDEERDQLFLECSLYVNPTLYEGFGMTAVEAMINKVPTLLSKIPAHFEVTKGLVNYYEPVESPEALAEMMEWCLNHVPATEELGDFSREMISEYHYLNISEKYYRFFEKVLRKA